MNFWGTKLFILSLLAFLVSLLFFVGEIMTRNCLFNLNYSLLSLSIGLFLLSYRRYGLKKEILPFAKSPIINKIIFPVFIVIDLFLIFGYFFVEKISLFQDIEVVKRWFGIYAIIVLLWIATLFLLKKQFKLW
ncbi:membrane hypothetical protein [uncultured Paludibacter sp.]|uniref:Uncharacterized protein n=1 Tax=uncultured Paludibacter sp. TaxID=497635 RepID=A0A653AFP5_9BACT|nr:membrane hypothetical protein [uncultured Paludibacter sp.]